MFPDLLRVWQDTRLIVLVAQTAAIYAAVLIPFKVGIPLIPGFAELRPANALPIVASLLLGPVAAWGAGIGNVIADCFGTLSPASLFGFLGNFCYGYLPYLLWGRLGPLSSGRSLDLRSWRRAPEFVVVCFAASAVCALVIAWGVDLLGLVPFGILAVAIFLNNFVMSLLLAPPLLLFLAPRVTRWGLRYEDIKKSKQAGGDRQRDRRLLRHVEPRQPVWISGQLLLRLPAIPPLGPTRSPFVRTQPGSSILAPGTRVRGGLLRGVGRVRPGDRMGCGPARTRPFRHPRRRHLSQQLRHVPAARPPAAPVSRPARHALGIAVRGY